MHQPILDYLETYLTDSNDREIPVEFHNHLAECSTCKEDLGAITGQSQLLRAFQDVQRPEPAVGFYARVLSRIEEQKPDSFWSVFLGPVLGHRLTYTCAALVLLLGTYLVSTEPGEHAQTANVIIGQSQASPEIDGAVQPRDRDAVLVNLASFQE